jgi:hypothetical protein
MHRSVVQQRVWRKRNDQELYRDLDIVVDIKKKRMEYTGHEVRMEDQD